MKTTLYADVLFLVDFSMDFISLWATSRLCSRPARAGRMSLGAAVGALYGTLAVVTGLTGALAYISAAAVSILMALTAFGGTGIAEILRESAVIWGSGAMLGGIMTSFLSMFGTVAGAESTAAPPGAGMAVFAAAALYATVRMITRTKSRKSVTVTVKYGGKEANLDVLCDSGNLLRDPVSGDPVMTVSADMLKSLIGDDVCSALTSCEVGRLGTLPVKVRLIPMKTASGSGMCAAFRPDGVAVSLPRGKKKAVRCLIAPVAVPRGYFGGRSGSLPADVL